jgi:TPP-dependent pyruvate/acetoin dehydrogenase alpha subunit
MGTALARSESETNLCVKAASYEMPAWSVDGMDVAAVDDAARRAVLAVRDGGGPLFLEARTYRFRAHSMFDPQLYRDKTEVEEWKKRDPIALWSARLKAEGLADDAELARIDAEADAEVARAVEFAEAGTWEPVEELARHVYTEPGSRAEPAR